MRLGRQRANFKGLTARPKHATLNPTKRNALEGEMPKYSDYREYERYRDEVNERRMEKRRNGISTYEVDAPMTYSKWLSTQRNG